MQDAPGGVEPKDGRGEEKGVDAVEPIIGEFGVMGQSDGQATSRRDRAHVVLA